MMQFRFFGSAVAFGCLVASAALMASCSSETAPAPTPSNGETFAELKTVRSQNGTMQTSLVAAKGPLSIERFAADGAKTVDTYADGQMYNGKTPAEVWRVKAGDTLKVAVKNDLPLSTNFHFHGFHVDPGGISDNVFLEIKPGASQDYLVALPKTHPAGFSWFHPHNHGTSDEQLGRGLAGLILVEGDHDAIPEVTGLKERLLALQSFKLDDKGVLTENERPARFVQTVNGQIGATMVGRPGENQLFRVVNTSSDGFFLLKLDGHKMRVIAEDAAPYSEAEEVDQFLLPPGKRVEFVTTLGAAGRYTLRNVGYEWGFASTPGAELATVVVAGEPMAPRALPTKVSDYLEKSGLMAAPVAKTRTFTFTLDLTTGAPIFQIDGKAFDHHAPITVQPKLGDTEEWELINDSDDDHPFHIHVNDFAITSVNDQPVAKPHLMDVGLIPRHGRIKVKHHFADFTGKFVFHCHILDHEDKGMMMGVEVLP